MEHFKSVGVFVRTTELQSFAAAAASLGLTPSAVSKAVSVLERSLGVRLLHRGSRGVTPTDEGARFYERCRSILNELEAAQREATGSRGSPKGRLRVALHTGIARARILAEMPRFLQAYPDLQVEVLLATGSRNLEAEGIDVGVFIGEPMETGLIARRVAELQMMTCASPAYLASHGMPRAPEDLERHNCMVYIRPNGRLYDEWTFTQGDDTRTVKVRGNYCSNEAYVLTEAAIAGAGMNRMFRTLHDAFIASGSLIPVLTDWQSQGPPVQVMYQRTSKNSAKVRAFADFITQLFSDIRQERRPLTPARRTERWPMYRA